MRVLMLHNRYLVPGGEDQSTAAETALLRDAGHQVELLEEDNRRIEQLGKVRTAFRTLWSPESYRTIYEKLRTGSFDVLHVQNFFPLWSPAVYYAAARARIPVVQTLRNYRLMCVNATFFRNGHLCEDCLGKSALWNGIRHACYRESRAASAVLAGMTGGHKLLGTWKNKVQVYVALTEFARDKYITGGLPAEKIVVKPNFVHPEPVPGNGGGGYALYIGRLSAEKGIAAMLKAWQMASNPVPLKIAGEGPLKELVAAACNHSIEYLGSQSPSAIMELLRSAEFLVFPSEWYEGMPRTVIEAFAAGTPVLASKIGATASMITSGENGFHFAPGDISGLREKVEWCSRNLQEVRSLRGNARKAFEENYTGAANLQMLLEIYHKALDGSSAAGHSNRG